MEVSNIEINHKNKGVTKTPSGKYGVDVYDYDRKKVIHYGVHNTYAEAREIYVDVMNDRLRREVQKYGHDINDGVIYNHDYVVFSNGDMFSTNGKKLHPTLCRYGYLQLRLNGKNVRHHRVVAECFVENPYDKPFVNHINGDKTDNRAVNLEWCTASENTNHASRMGLLSTGENRYNAKLTRSAVNDIRQNYSPGDPLYGSHALSKKYSVDRKVIYDVIKGNIWKDT